MRIKTRLIVFSIIVLHLLLLFAGFVAPYGPIQQNRELPYAPPSRLHFRDNAGFHLRPFVYQLKTSDDGYAEDVSRPYPVHFFLRGDSYSLFDLFPMNLHLFGVQGPAKLMLAGSDEYGRDEFSRVLYGGQISVAAGLAATMIALSVGTAVGIVAGYFGGWIDEALMGTTELFLSLPWLYFLIGVRAFLPLHLSPIKTFFLLTCVIGMLGWTRPARLVRGIVLWARTQAFVAAARGFGASDIYLLRRHILPETFGILLTQAALLVPRYIAAEVTLSFFGLGVSEPTASWGTMLSALQHYSVLVSYGWLLTPAVATFVTSVIYFLLADAFHSHLESQLT